MQVICLQEEAFYELTNEIVERIKKIERDHALKIDTASHEPPRPRHLKQLLLEIKFKFLNQFADVCTKVV